MRQRVMIAMALACEPRHVDRARLVLMKSWASGDRC
jgi:ABC-type glutathione transport system ATPase component